MPKPAASQQHKLDAVAVLAWYDRHARTLPWRVSPAGRARGVRPDPYRVWLSEIMLQQTTVAAVGKYYARFLMLWPTVEALAAAPLAAVLVEWAGLGYYARARNLHACAEAVVARFGGKFPETSAELLTLPGIGPYTAAAIRAIAFDHPASAVDGNVERGGGQRLDRRPALHKAVKVVTDRGHRGLLQHDLRQPHDIRRIGSAGRRAPRQGAAVAVVPVE